MGNLKKLHKTAAACTAPVQVLKAIISWLLNWQQHLADLVLLQSGAGELRKSTLFYRKGSNSDFHCYLQAKNYSKDLSIRGIVLSLSTLA